MIEVSLKSIEMPTDYIRQGINKSYVDELTEIINSSSGWPFPPVVATHKRKNGNDKYSLIDGAHRTLAAKQANVTTIPVNVITTQDSARQFLQQLVLNMKHGLRLSKSERTEAIKKLRAAKVPLKLIASEMGVSMASVSRIATGDQATGETGKRKGGGRKKGSTPSDSSTPSTPSTPEDPDVQPSDSENKNIARNFYERVDTILTMFKDYKTPILEYIKQPGVSKDMVNSMVGNISQLLDSIKEAVK